MQISPTLASAIVENALPWPQNGQVHVEAVLRQYVLHDSHWLGLYTNCGWDDSAVAVVHLDVVWNPSVKAVLTDTDNWPLLLLRFSCVSTIQLAGFSDLGNIQRGITGVVSTALSDEEYVTRFDDHYGASVTLRHFPLLDVLLMTPRGEGISLPNQQP